MRVVAVILLSVTVAACSDLAVYDASSDDAAAVAEAGADGAHADAARDASGDDGPMFVSDVVRAGADAPAPCTEAGAVCAPDQVCGFGDATNTWRTCCWRLTEACGPTTCGPRDTGHSVFCDSTYYCCWTP